MVRPVDWSAVPIQFVLWSIVVCGSAAPSFFWGANIRPAPLFIAAMVLGIAIFVISYTLIASLHRVRSWKRRNKALRISLRIAYGTRLLLSAISVVIPIGLIADGYVGIVSTAVVNELFSGELNAMHYADNGKKATFAMVLATTLVQGVLLNIAIAIYASIVYGILRFFVSARPQAGLCSVCGYDLRASTGICSECGTPLQRDVQS